MESSTTPRFEGAAMGQANSAACTSSAAAGHTAANVATTSDSADGSAARELHEIAKRLTAADAVLEKDIFSVATAYLRLRRGQIKEVIRMLSDNFVGYPAMSSLVCEWLAMLADDPESHEGLQGMPSSAMFFSVAACCLWLHVARA
jgi:hypothetical protein